MIDLEVKCEVEPLIARLTEASEEIEPEIAEALKEIADKLVAKMKGKVRVGTGALRDSIEWRQVKKLAFQISMIYYGLFLEWGTSKMPPYPFIRPSIEEVRSEIEEIVWFHLEDSFK